MSRLTNLPRALGRVCSSQCITRVLPRKVTCNKIYCISSTNHWSRHFHGSMQLGSNVASIVDRSNIILTDAYLNRLSVENLSPKEICVALKELYVLSYEQVRHIPWLQGHHYQISFIQLAMNGMIQELMGPVLQHPNLPSLLSALQENCSQFTESELVNAYACLLWMGIETHSDVVVALHIECSKRVHKFDLELISCMADAMRTLNRTDLKIIGKLMQRFSEILPNYGSGKSEEASILAMATTSCLQYCSYSFSEKCVEKALELTNQPGAMENRDFLGSYLRMCRRLNIHFYQESSQAVHCLNELLVRSRDAAINKASELEAHHVAEICSNLKMCRSYTKQCSVIMQKRALELLDNPDIQISDISNLFYAFTRDTDMETKRHLESILYRHIDNVDVLILSNLVDSLMTMGCNNRDIHSKLQEKIIEHSDNIMKFVTRFRRILRLLSHRNFYSPVLQAKFYDSVLAGLEAQHGIKAWSISMISRYLLPSMQYFIPENIYQKLLQIIPHSSLQDLYKIVGGLNNIRQPWTRQMQNQVLQLQHDLHANILQKLTEYSDFSKIHQGALAMVINCNIRDPIVTEKIMAFFPKCTKNLTDIDMQKVSSILHRLGYYMPEVCDDVMRHVCKNQATMEFEHLITTLLMLAKVGHVIEPELQEKFSQACLQMYHRQADQLDMKTVVMFAQCLSQLQMYPRDLLQEIFRIEYIEKIDAFIERVPQTRQAVESMLMKLNRQVILECPEMDIPWFHEQYCKDNVVSHKYDKSQFHHQLDGAMMGILKDGSFFKAGSYTPYYYYNDFECVLNKDNKPMPIMSIIGRELPDGARRLAISGISDSQYCYNSKQLCGYEQMKKRHLELMGYSVILVPHFEWFSMALSDWPSKVNYLRNKIFSR